MQLIEGMVRLLLEKRRGDSAEMVQERAQEEAASTQLSDETEPLGRPLEDHRLSMMREPMEAIVDQLLDSLPEGEFDIVPHFAVPLPIRAIAHILNVPSDRMADFKRWSDDSIANIGTAISDDERVAAVGQHVEQAVGVGRDDRLPHRQSLERGQRRAFPQ
jgi:cytochrome P450